MKLGEALTERAACQRRIQELRSRLKANVMVQEGETPDEDPQVLLDDLTETTANLRDLIVQINRTNMQATISDGRTLMEALAAREALGSLSTSMHDAAEAATDSHSRWRYGRSELRWEKQVNVKDVLTAADGFAKQRRELDTMIQEANWTADLVV